MNYAYSTLQSARDFGILTTDLDDPTVLRLIKTYSQRVNSITNKVFIPTSTTINMTLSGGTLVQKIPGPPVISVSSVVFTDPTGTQTTLANTTYQVFDNNLFKIIVPLVNDIDLAILQSWYYQAFRTDYMLFNDIYQTTQDQQFIDNLAINAIVGVIENSKSVNITTTSAIVPGSNSFTVTDASQLEPKDTFVFNNKYTFIANDINYQTNTILIDAAPNMPSNAVPSGSTATVYGRVPLQIEEVINLFLRHHKTLTKSVGGNMRRERIGNYFYETTGNSMGLTGITEIDSILYTYMDDGMNMTWL